MMWKQTLGTPIHFSGKGIHTGKDVHLHLIPSEEGRIVFERTDLGGAEIEPDPSQAEAVNSTTLVSGAARVQTVEHLLAALFARGLDSLRIRLDGPEIPAFDGSAKSFCEALSKAGIRSLAEKRRSLRIRRTCRIDEGEARFLVSPAEDCVLSYRIDYSHPAIRVQERSIILTPEAFQAEIAPARTFGFLEDVPAMRDRGLALGGSLANALVLDETGVINGPLRFPDEFVRHKLLDLLGDLSLLGYPLRGRFEVFRGGHGLHLKGVRFLLNNPSFWELTEC